MQPLRLEQKKVQMYLNANKHILTEAALDLEVHETDN